jgi:hypothetical protein
MKIIQTSLLEVNKNFFITKENNFGDDYVAFRVDHLVPICDPFPKNRSEKPTSEIFDIFSLNIFAQIFWLKIL